MSSKLLNVDRIVSLIYISLFNKIKRTTTVEVKHFIGYNISDGKA